MEQENEIKTNFDEKTENFFKLDYKGQNINKNKFFKEFKVTMFKKNNNKGLIYFCPEDNAYFFDSSEYKYQNGICPLCGKDICYFCSKRDQLYRDKCCLSKKMHYLFYKEGFIFFEDYFRGKLLFALIPLLNLILFVGGIHKLIYKIEDIYIREMNCYWNFEGYLKSEFDRDYVNHCDIFKFFVALDVGSTIILIIPYAILNIIFTIILIIISIPFKFYPIKYLAGIAYKGWNPW